MEDSKKKIAMASSFGSGYDAPEDERILDKYYINKFDYIGVREEDGVRLCKEYFGVNADQVIDPVFICDKTVYYELADKLNYRTDYSFISAYILGPDIIKYNILKKISEIQNCEMKIIENPNIPGVFKQKLGVEALHTPSVEEWLYYIKNCEFFVGDSFHGLCFALIFNKPFLITVNSNVSGLQRFSTLLKMIGLENRLFFTDKDDIQKIEEIISQPIDYSIVNRIIDNHTKDSYEWLLNAIKSEKRYNTTAYDVLIKKLEKKINKIEDYLKLV